PHATTTATIGVASVASISPPAVTGCRLPLFLTTANHHLPLFPTSAVPGCRLPLFLTTANHHLPLFPTFAVPSLLAVGISSKKGTPMQVLDHYCSPVAIIPGFLSKLLSTIIAAPTAIFLPSSSSLAYCYAAHPCTTIIRWILVTALLFLYQP
ncbi:hypothetical protein B296_00007470, partial [Ensete ventricosum]